MLNQNLSLKWDAQNSVEFWDTILRSSNLGQMTRTRNSQQKKKKKKKKE